MPFTIWASGDAPKKALLSEGSRAQRARRAARAPSVYVRGYLNHRPTRTRGAYACAIPGRDGVPSPSAHPGRASAPRTPNSAPHRARPNDQPQKQSKCTCAGFAQHRIAYVGGCCHPPLADSAFGETGRLAAPWSLEVSAFRVPPVPGRRAPGSMEKINLSCSSPQDI